MTSGAKRTSAASAPAVPTTARTASGTSTTSRRSCTAALAGSTPQDGAQRAQQLVDERFGRGLEAEATAVQDGDGTIRVQVDATLPLVGLIGPAGALSVEGRAVDEEEW
ncbi:hypothetical protein [Brachybacterium paraconglomeratum]|uniref:hypothetical protein n=1 Tax=Brachybacterium paraconglomeratum TaxID=173362 RepID=UPI003F7C968D